MKKFFLLPVVFILMGFSAYAASFPDVQETHKDYKAIEYLKEKGIISGYENGNFGPDDSLNRAQAMKIITGAFNVAYDGTYEILFPDVLSKDWFFPYVMGGQAAKIVDGYPDGKFRPDQDVNLAEALKFMIVSSKVALPITAANDIFVDVPKSAWYAPHALYARDHNVVFADDSGKIYPEKPMKRSDFAQIIYRMMIVLDSKEKPYPIQNDWPLYESTTLPFKMKYEPAWKILNNISSKEVVFFKADSEFAQFSPTRLYPNSAKIVVTLDKNEGTLSDTAYFDNIKAAFPGANYTAFKLGDFSAFEVLYPERRTVDWYVYLSNGHVLVIYTEYGDGVLSFQFPRIIKAMLTTLEYKEIPGDGTDYSQILSQIFANVLVQNKGMEMLNLLPDKLIIETDSIGVGTGPIDYYYSTAVDYTFKYERANDVILATKQGRTSAF